MSLDTAWTGPLLRSYGARADELGPSRIEAQSLQLASPAVRPLLAHLATRGATSFEQLRRSFLSTGAPPATLTALSEPWLAALARVVALQSLDPEDARLGLAVYRHLHQRGHVAALGPPHAKLFGDLLLSSNGDRELRSMLDSGAGGVEPADRAMLEADLANPWRAGPWAESPESWVRRFRSAAMLADDPAVHVASPHRTPFDGLTASTTSPAVSDALVSVIFPVYRPDGSLRLSVASICAQTWSDLEILLVDDGSGHEYDDLLRDVAAQNDRIRLVRAPRNRGAYAARNLGLRLARGRFVTFQDYDDWSHPRRIERQVEPLLADPSLVATHSRCVRVDESLVLAHPGYHPIRHNASSLMIRRHDVVLGVGYFDEVRKSADSEYAARIVTYFGRRAVENLRRGPVLACVRRLEHSLSRSDFRAGWHHPDRVWYRDAYTRWHERTARPDLFVDAAPTRRPFSAPRAFVGTTDGPLRLDLLLVADWHVLDGADRARVLGHGRARAATGDRVGVMHASGFAVTPKVRPVLPGDVIDAVDDGTLTWAEPHAQGSASQVVVVTPSSLQFGATTLAGAWEVGSVRVVRDLEPGVATSGRGAHDEQLVGEQVRSVFGRAPDWVDSGDVGASLAVD